MPEHEVLQDRPDRPVVRRGDTVRHPLQLWTPAVHALLGHLADIEFPYAPRMLGIEDGTEILTYLPGESGPDGWARVVDEAGLVACARLLRDRSGTTRSAFGGCATRRRRTGAAASSCAPRRMG
jgi:hypothetical protein